MTQEYASRKIVTAWREDRRGDIPEGSPEGYIGEVIEGYAVKYNDGYTSWCPKLKFEEDTMPLGNIAHLPMFQQRLLAERADLAFRSEGLGKYLASLTHHSSPISPKHNDMLTKQHGLMTQLLAVLDERIEDLSDVSNLAATVLHDDAMEDVSKGYTEQLASAPKLGEPDDWLREKLAAVSDSGDGKRDFFQDWTSGPAPLIAKVDVKTQTLNVYSITDPSNDMDNTDTISRLTVSKVFDSLGNELPVKITDIDTPSSWKTRFSVHGPEFDFYIEADLQRGVLEMVVNKSSEGFTAELAIQRINHNRRS